MTAEEEPERDYWKERLNQRIAERLEEERNMEEERTRAAQRWVYRLRLRIARAIAP